MKNKNFKIFGICFLVLALAVAGKYIYQVNIKHNFEVISEGKFYKSGVIPPDELPEVLKEYNIKTVIDLRFPESTDEVNNPEVAAQLKSEQEAVAKVKQVTYVNNGSEQVPSKKNLDTFFAILDDPKNYPILIHCYHGVGRAELYSALYRIEYENWSPNDARLATRDFVKWSSFDIGTPKGDFLQNYTPRKKKN